MLFPVYPNSVGTSTLPHGRGSTLWPILFLLLINLFIYSPVSNFDYLAIDDAIHTEGNPRIYPFTWDNVTSFWKAPFENAYMPITYTAWAALAHLGKNKPIDLETTKNRMNPEGNKYKPGVFHAANGLVHFLTSVAVFLLLNALVGSPLAATGGALLFAVHPLQVETVCWITGLRDLLAGLFSMLCLWLYLKSIPTTHREKIHYRYYGGAFFLFFCAVLCKSSALVIPAVAGLIAFFYYKRPIKNLLFDFAPWGLLLLPIMKVFTGLNDSVALKVVYPTTFPQRLLIAGDAITFYLSKLVFPSPLTMDYGRTPQYVLGLSSKYFLAFLPVLLGILCTVAFFLKKWTLPLVALGIFIVGLGPILGITPFIFQHISTTADRYVYLSLLAPALAFAFLLKDARSKRYRPLIAILLITLILKSSHQVDHWKNNLTLFTHSLELNQSSWLASNNLGTVFEGKGEFDTAMSLYERSGEIANIPSAWNNAGAMAVEIGDYPQALFFFQKAIDSSGSSSWALHNLATTYWKMGNQKVAHKYYDMAGERNDRYREGYKNPIILRKDDGKSNASG